MKKDVIVILSVITGVLLVCSVLFQSNGLFLAFGIMCIVIVTYRITAPKNTADEIKLVVDYTKTVEQVIADGNYDWKADNITAENFPISPEMIGKKVEVTAKPFHFNRDISSEYVISEMNQAGYRPATLMELLVLGSLFPELQKQFSIVALGSIWSNNTHVIRYVTSLRVYNSKREICLDRFADIWSAPHCFLGIRK